MNWPARVRHETTSLPKVVVRRHAAPFWLRLQTRRAARGLRARVLVGALLGGLELCLACHSPVSVTPDTYELPPPDLSVDPASLRPGAPVYRCGRWVGLAPPRSRRMLLDVHFGRRGPEDPIDRPLEEHLRAIESVGGKALFSFAFPAVRARIDAGRVPALLAHWPFISVYDVPDARRYDWLVSIGYSMPLQPSDSSLIVALGGSVVLRIDRFNFLGAYVPNASIAQLRTNARVSYVESSGEVCRA